MKESRTDYILTDEDGDEIKATFVHRFCNCMVPGCVDDQLEMTLPGDDEPCSVQLFRMLTPYIEGVFNGELKVRKVSGESDG